MDLNLKWKTAIVTGGTTGLGAGISEVLAEEGMNVVACYLSDEKGAKRFVEGLCEKHQTKCIAAYGDVTNADDINKIIESAQDIYGRIDVLVNNAAIWPTTKAEEMPDDEWKKVIDVNLTGPFMFSKRIIKHFLKYDIKGHIVNISSKSAFSVASPDHAHYVSAKGGLNLMTKALAREFSKYGIIINGVAPGMIRTPINEDKLSQGKWMKYYEERIPVGRVASNKEVAYTVAFLASEKANFIAGCIVDATGGMLI